MIGPVAMSKSDQTGPQDAPSAGGGTVDPDDVARFAALAETWWDPNGPFKPLHKFNPARLAVIRRMLADHFDRDRADLAPLAGLTLVDLGCGGGLVSEPMARLGAQVLGVDAGAKNVGTARARHAALGGGLPLDYMATDVETLAARGAQFDIVLVLEVVEHVADLSLFLKSAGKLLKPGGMLIAATLNRTIKAYALAILGAEYVLGWLPRGTHQWDRFVTPRELADHLQSAGLEIADTVGFSYNPLTDRWREGRDLGVNYMMSARKPHDAGGLSR